MRRVVAYVPDLMDRSKVSAGAPAGTTVDFVADPGDLVAAAAEADLVVVDLSRPGVVDALGGIDARVVGFARHTAPELMKAARAAGCDTVLARSAFFPRVADLLG